MRHQLAFLTGLLIATGTAEAQPAAEPPSAPLSGAATAEATLQSDSAAPTATETAPAEPATTTSDASAPSEEAAAPNAVAVDSGEVSAEELAALGLGPAGEPSVDTDFHLSGFADFSVQLGVNSVGQAVTTSDRAFAIGNINLYLKKNINESFRTMFEIRFMYLPNGSTSGIGAMPTSTATSDYADFARIVHWGGIDIQRAYIEWQPLNFLTLRVGEFLTPYGVWNVDHGTPTIIPAAKPFVIGSGFFPNRQTGFELYGRTDLGSDGALGYHLTLSNGTGPVMEYIDLDRNKALGARLYYEYRGLGELLVGGSGYYGRNSEGSTATDIVKGELMAVTKLTTQSDVLAFGLDAVWKYAGIHAQAEWLCMQRKFTDDGRVQTVGLTGQPGFPPDSFSWGMYGLLGYRFSWYGVMPFVMYQQLDQPDGISFKGYHIGLNVRPIDALALKLQYDHVQSDQFAIKIAYMQIAWAF